jgi:long-chain acyl-CoA synthetase
VPVDVEIPDLPVTRLLDDAVARFPRAMALAFLGTAVSYRDLAESVDRFAAGLARMGVHSGDRVGLLLPNCPQFVVAFFATLRLGAVVCPANPLAAEAELSAQLADSGAAVVVCWDKAYATLMAARAGTAVEEVIVTSHADYLPTVRRQLLRLPLPGNRARRAELSADLDRVGSDGQRPAPHRFTALLRQPGSVEQAEVDPARDTAVLQYTTGTTGPVKGARLSHRNLVANACQIRAWLPRAQPGREVTLGLLPLFHVYGMTLCVTVTVLLAGRLVLLPRFEVDLVLAAIDEHRPTLFPGVPPIYQALADTPATRQHDLRSIRACLSGAMRLPPETQAAFERISGGRLVEGYGMTETSPATHCSPLAGPRRTGIGVPLPGTECALVDPEDASREVAVGEVGEIAVRGPQVFLGYWGDPPPEAERTPDGHLLTGDLAVMDENGWFELVDRKKDIIVAGGFNIAPAEVEQVIERLDAVARCCVVGLPDRYRGETVKAYVVRRAGASLSEDDVIEACAAELTAYKVPRLVEFRDRLPLAQGVGKPLRRALRAEEEAAGTTKARTARSGGRKASKSPKQPAKKSTGRKSGDAAPSKATATRTPNSTKKPASTGKTAKSTKKPASKQAVSTKSTAKKATGQRSTTKKSAQAQPTGRQKTGGTAKPRENRRTS